MRLLRDKNFNVAVVLSAACHLIFVFSVMPVLIPEDIKANSTKISFLGSILEKVVTVTERPFILDRVSMMQKIERMRAIDSGKFSLTPPEAASKAIGVERDKEEIASFRGKYECLASKRHYIRQSRPRIRFKEDAITGEAADRAILYRPDLSKISIFPAWFGSDYNISIRFRISRHGFVERPECVVSSGSSEIDQMAIRYVRRWQFVPHEEGIGDVQEGIIRVSF